MDLLPSVSQCLEDAELKAEVDDVWDVVKVEDSVCRDPLGLPEGSCMDGVYGAKLP